MNMDPKDHLRKQGHHDLVAQLEAIATGTSHYEEVVALPLPEGMAQFGRFRGQWYAIRDDRGRVGGLRVKDDVPAKQSGRDINFRPYPYTFFELRGTLFAEVSRKGELVGAIGPMGKKLFQGTKDVTKTVVKSRKMVLALYSLMESKGWKVRFTGLIQDDNPNLSTHAILRKESGHMILIDYANDIARYGMKRGSRLSLKGKVNLRGLPKLLATFGR